MSVFWIKMVWSLFERHWRGVFLSSFLRRLLSCDWMWNKRGCHLQCLPPIQLRCKSVLQSNLSDPFRNRCFFLVMLRNNDPNTNVNVSNPWSPLYQIQVCLILFPWCIYLGGRGIINPGDSFNVYFLCNIIWWLCWYHEMTRLPSFSSR